MIGTYFDWDIIWAETETNKENGRMGRKRRNDKSKKKEKFNWRKKKLRKKEKQKLEETINKSEERMKGVSTEERKKQERSQNKFICVWRPLNMLVV